MLDFLQSRMSAFEEKLVMDVEGYWFDELDFSPRKRG
jgi:hypothetical protein